MPTLARLCAALILLAAGGLIMAAPVAFATNAPKKAEDDTMKTCRILHVGPRQNIPKEICREKK